MAKVAVAIATFRRPRGLVRLLSAVEKLETSAVVSVLVADNDAERHEGFDLCQRLRDEYRWPLEAIVVPERGIAQVRNALSEHILEKSGAQFVAMLDDDEWPAPHWLDDFPTRAAGNGRRRATWCHHPRVRGYTRRLGIALPRHCAAAQRNRPHCDD